MYSNEYTLTSINNSLRFFKQKSLVDSKIIRNFAVEIKTIKNMRENNQYGSRFFVRVDIAFAAMVVYTFNGECYSSEEVSAFSEKTCKALAKYDSENVHIYQYETKNINNTCCVIY